MPIHHQTEFISPAFFRQDALKCARQLIGATLQFGKAAGIIVETEAYRAEGDPACHTFVRQKARTFVETYPPGSTYVYLNYGVHWMLNFLTANDKGRGFVLIRAIQPTTGIGLMTKRRNGQPLRNLCSGPGKLSQAMKINGSLHGQNPLQEGQLILRSPLKPLAVTKDGRIGISVAQELPWRFCAKDFLEWVSVRPKT